MVSPGLVIQKGLSHGRREPGGWGEVQKSRGVGFREGRSGDGGRRRLSFLGLVPYPAKALLTPPTPRPTSPHQCPVVFTQLGVEKLEEEEPLPPRASSLAGTVVCRPGDK